MNDFAVFDGVDLVDGRVEVGLKSGKSGIEAAAKLATTLEGLNGVLHRDFEVAKSSSEIGNEVVGFADGVGSLLIELVELCSSGSLELVVER